MKVELSIVMDEEGEEQGTANFNVYPLVLFDF